MKGKESHKLTAEEMKVEERRIRDRIYELRSQAVTGQLDNPREPGQLRKDLARVLTEVRARQNKQEAKA